MSSREPTDRLRRLRDRAEWLVAQQAPDDGDPSTHELRVHQTELELQNVELARLQAEVEAARDRYRELYRGAPVPLLSIDAQRRIVDVNDAAARLFGRSRTELTGAALEQYTGPAGVLDALVSEALANAGTTIRRRAALDDGRRSCDIDAIALGGPIPRIRLAIVDTSERDAREAEIRDRNAMLQAVLDTGADMIVVARPDGVVVSANDAITPLAGYRPAELVGQHIGVLLPSLADDGAWLAQADEAMGTRAGPEVIGRRRDGSEFPADLSLGTATVGHERLLVLFIRDQTFRTLTRQSLRKERDLLRTVLDTAPVIVLVLDADARIVHANRFFEELTGASLADIQGTSWVEEFIPPEERDQIAGVHEHTVRTGSSWRVVNAIALPDGGTRLIEWFNSILPDDTGRVLAVGRDVTDERRLNARFVEAQKMEVVGRMAGGIAHDFKNLLAGIKGVCAVASTRARGMPGVLAAIQQIDSAASRGTDMIRELLAISRDRPVEPQPIDLRGRIEDGRLMYHRILGNQVQLVLRLADVDAVVQADPGQLDRMILNLLVNARDAMPRGGSVTLELRLADPPELDGQGLRCNVGGTHIVLEIRDTGTGMDAETRARIFDPFFTTKREGRGTGLGLAMVHATVRQLRGVIRVESVPDRGTTFVIALPRHGVSPAPAPERTVAPRSRTGTVLVVDDDELVRLGVEHQLGELGYVPVVASDGAEALAILRAGEPVIDAVLSDVRMPGLDGPSLAARIAEEWPQIPVLLMSAQPGDLLMDEGRVHSSLAPSIIEKPFDDDTLVASLDRALGSAG